MKLRNALLAIHRRLLPNDPEIGFLPYVWLVYLAMLFIGLNFTHTSAQIWLGTIASVVVFLILYFRGYWVSGHAIIKYMAAIAILGLGVATFNPGSSVYIIFACAFAPALQSVKKGIIAALTIISIMLGFSWFYGLSYFFYFPATVFSLLVSFVNIYQAELAKKNKLIKKSQEEVQHLARSAERERIARDLHDVMGHTFSMITIKAQLARKLLDADVEQAKQELAELESASRQALAEIRGVVSNYRKRDLNEEITLARKLLDAAEIDASIEVDITPLPELFNEALAYIIREGVNNIVKHSDCRTCDIQLKQEKGLVELQIKDDGEVSSYQDGNGLNGIRERVKNINGALQVLIEGGFTLHVKCHMEDTV
ncbi:MAG: hypothetical protein GJ680_18820 [Alteromonadaceae bacterium]|nr:hypothetical protein [Alteromonadaceae bacterium]